ncbi:cyclic-di-AMP receptor [Clostridium sp.]|uniref:cyclic-di-AMP receptor n=1 Tax=Clostridium sp. TaxID=1506 RepID=UPI00260EE5EA|nr:cyclic-di-AMP receptor [Clostridium sp.]
MKLVISIVQDDDALDLVDALNEKGYSVTKLATTGGFLKSGNTTLLAGVQKEKVDYVIDIIKEVCETRKGVVSAPTSVSEPSGVYIPYPMEVQIGGATIFVVDVDKFVKI